MHPLYDEFYSIFTTENKEKCVNWVLTNVKDTKIDIISLYTEILTPALNNIVCQGENEYYCIWKEHIKTSIVRTIIESCYLVVLKERDLKCYGILDQKVLIMCPPDEYHEIGARMVSDFFIIAGYQSIFIGGNTPLKAFLSAIEIEKPHYIAISVSNPYHLSSLQKIIKQIKANSPETLKIIVGGQAFLKNPELYKKIGADLHIQSFNEICNLREAY